VLNSLSDLPIELTYRLFTAPSPAGELGALGKVRRKHERAGELPAPRDSSTRIIALFQVHFQGK